MADIDYRDIPAPGMGVGAGMMRAMRRTEPAPLRLIEPESPRRPPPREHAGLSEPSAAPLRPAGERVQRAVNLAGALTSLILVAGLGLWAYKLAVRDVTGVPVVRALAGPARVAPTDPGGDLAQHQGLAVNAVTAEGTAAAPPDSLTLAPKPTDLDPADLAPADLAIASLAGPPAERPRFASQEPLTGEPLGEGGRIVDPLTAPATPLEGAVALSARPQPRPGSEAASARSDSAPGDDLAGLADEAVLVAAISDAEAALAPDPTIDLDPANLASGTRLVQIGTYDSVEAARAGWEEVVAAFGPVMVGKRRVIEPAGGTGGTFFRLRAEGFADVAEARRFCAVVKGRVSTCVPALVR
ncbi:MAG: SPOR domain-containing protein [Paracoccaceae bacterium]